MKISPALGNRRARSWTCPDQRHLQASHSIAKTSTADGNWEPAPAHTLASNHAQAYWYDNAVQLSFKRAYHNVLSSYRAEALAAKGILSQAYRVPSHINKVTIFTDSMSLLLKLAQPFVLASKEEGRSLNSGYFRDGS
jgi:hypothetical protein